MLQAKDFRFVGFLCRYALLVGLIFAAMSFVVSQVAGSFSARDVLIGASIGVLVGTVTAIGVLRAEMSALLQALVQGTVMAMADRASQVAPQLDLLSNENLAVIHRESLRIARDSLRGKAFHTLDLEAELVS